MKKSRKFGSIDVYLVRVLFKLLVGGGGILVLFVSGFSLPANTNIMLKITTKSGECRVQGNLSPCQMVNAGESWVLSQKLAFLPADEDLADVGGLVERLSVDRLARLHDRRKVHQFGRHRPTVEADLEI